MLKPLPSSRWRFRPSDAESASAKKKQLYGRDCDLYATPERKRFPVFFFIVRLPPSLGKVVRMSPTSIIQRDIQTTRLPDR